MGTEEFPRLPCERAVHLGKILSPHQAVKRELACASATSAERSRGGGGATLLVILSNAATSAGPEPLLNQTV